MSEGTQLSRDSVISMSNKLLSMESELDNTLRLLDGSKKSPAHSKSPSASKRFSARGQGSSSRLRRDSSIDPLASSRRSSSIDVRDQDLKVRELVDKVESLEKENQLLDTKYAQQRKRLNLVNRNQHTHPTSLCLHISRAHANNKFTPLGSYVPPPAPPPLTFALHSAQL